MTIVQHLVEKFSSWQIFFFLTKTFGTLGRISAGRFGWGALTSESKTRKFPGGLSSHPQNPKEKNFLGANLRAEDNTKKSKRIRIDISFVCISRATAQRPLTYAGSWMLALTGRMFLVCSSHYVTGTHKNVTFRENLENLSRPQAHFQQKKRIYTWQGLRGSLQKKLSQGSWHGKKHAYMTLGDSISNLSYD